MYIINNERKNESEVARGALALTLSVIFVKIIGFIYKVPLSYVLGDDGMGYFNSAYTVFTFFYMLCSGGVPRAVSILITEMRAKGRGDSVEKVLATALATFSSIGAILTALFLLFSRRIADFIGNSPAALSLVAIAPALTFVAASGVLRGYLVGYGKMGSVALSEVLEASVKFVVGMAFALFAVREGYGAPMISAYTVIGVTAGSLIGGFVLLVSANICKKENKTRQKYENKISTKEVIFGILRISVPITLSSAIMGISSLADLGLIMRRLRASGLSETEAVLLYGNFTTLVVPMLNLVSALISPIGTAALPHLTREYSSENKEGFYKLLSSVISFSAFICIPIALAFYYFPYEILALIFNDSSALTAAPMLALIAPSTVLLPMLTLVHTALESAFRQRAPILSMAVLVSVKISATYFLIERIGIIGAPIGTSLSYATAICVSVLLLYRYTGASLSVFLSAWRPLLAAFCAVGAARMMYERLPDMTTASFLICAAISVVLYVIFMTILSLKQVKGLPKFVNLNKKEKA